MKKFLSLVLALVMTMSLVTISAGATDVAKNFTDKGKIQYNDAVDVVSAAKIIDGYTDGSFAPTGTLTRGAAAKIICNMVLGPTTASALGVDAKPFKDVAVDNVFAGYIAYCSQQGIINGYADGNFRPAGLVTGNQFMKMLLGALGYDGSIEGFTGANWTVAVIKLAKSLELDDGNDAFVGSKAMTREEACLYAFNTLKATMVEYKDNSTISVGNITISNKSKATEVEDNNNKKGTYKKDELLQFCEKYFDKLTGKSATDDFGRPATKWSYDGDSIGTYADDADDTMVVAKARTAEQVVLTDSDYFAYATGDVNSNVVLYVNGVETSTTKSGLTGVTLKAGDQVEVFEDDDDNVKTVAVIRYSLAKIDEVSTSLSSTYTKKGASASITLQDLNDASIGITYYDKYDGDSAKELPGFSADTYKADVVLAIALNGNKVLDSYVATVAEGKVTAYNSGEKATVTAGGTEYKLHEIVNTANGNVTATKVNNVAGALNFNYDDSTYTVYTDKNSYVVGIDESASVKIEDVYYVTCLTKGNSLYNGTVYAQAVALKDGSVTEFKMGQTGSNLTDNTTAFGAAWNTQNYGTDNVLDSIAGLYTFDKDGSVYTAKKYNTSSDSTYYVYGVGGRLDKSATTALAAPATIGTSSLKKDDTNMTVDGAKVYLNSSTNYVKVEGVGDDIDVKTVTGGTSVQATNTTAIAVAIKTNSNYVASYVILVNTDFVTASSDDVVFVHEQSNTSVSYTDADGKTKTGYSTELYFLDGSGKVETVTVKDKKSVGFYTWEINDDKVYELTSNVDSLYAQYTASAKYDDETGFIGIGSQADPYVELTGVYSNALTVGTTGSATSGGKTVSGLSDVDFAKNVIIADDRGQATRDADVYTTEITSVSTLKSAIDKVANNGSDVMATVYYDNGEVIMVYVWSVANANGSNPSTPTIDASNYTVTVGLGNVLTVNYYTGMAHDDNTILDQIQANLVSDGYTNFAAVYGAGVWTITATKSGNTRTFTYASNAIESYKVKVDGVDKLLAATTQLSALNVADDTAVYVTTTAGVRAVETTLSKTIVNGNAYETGYYAVTAPDAVTAAGNAGVYTATVNKTYAKSGETITVTVKMTAAPKTGYVDTVTTNGTDSTSVKFADTATVNSELTLTYTMGAGNSKVAMSAAAAK